MSTTSSASPPRDHGQPPRRLKLVMNTPTPQRQTPNPTIKEESSSPTRPSYSPVTPTLPQSNLANHDTAESRIDEPEPLPLSLDDNPDAIALRATLSILQMQRQQSLRDIRHLDKMKQEAMRNPKAFVDDLKTGKLQKPTQPNIAFDTEESDEERKHEHSTSRFGTLPTPQNIVRCPPIEWSKYHVAGEALDTMHDVQQQYPGVTEEALARDLQPQPHEIAAPYRPFVDRIEPRSTSKDIRDNNG
jgi:hypothetical protein